MMNERIRELTEQAVNAVDVVTGNEALDDELAKMYIPDCFAEKFAELIVRECINKVRSRQMFSIEDEHNIHHAFDLLVYDLESYFGVEE